MLFPTWKTTIIVSVLIFSIFLTITSIVLIIFVFPNLISSELYKALRLNNGTNQYDTFVEIPFPVHFKVYFFNVENPESILAGEKPVLKEVGPYVYKESLARLVEAVDDEEDTITFKEIHQFEFDKDASGNLSDEDTVTVANLLVDTFYQTEENSFFSRILYSCIPDIFQNLSTPFINVKVKDILFDGLKFCEKKLSLCHILCMVIKNEPGIQLSQDGSLQVAILDLSRIVNNLYTIKRGNIDVHSLGEMVKVNNSKYTHFWDRLEPENPCDDVEGSYAFVYPPEINKTLPLKLYTTVFCRSVQTQFAEKVHYKGLVGHKFIPNSPMYRSTYADKSEDCYCTKLTPDVNGKDSCYLDGVLDMKSCIGQPILVSNPHFMDADPVYLQSVGGLTPNEKKHATSIVIEPETGVMLEGNNRIQINTVLRPFHAKAVKNITRVVMPILWVDEEFLLPDEYVDKLNGDYFNKVLMANIIQWTLLGVGLLSVTLLGGYLVAKEYLYAQL